MNPKYIAALVERKKTRPITDVCNELLKVALSWCAASDDIDAYHAPRECMDLVNRAKKKQVAAILKKYGWSAIVLREVIVARTDARWFYFSPLSMVI